MCANHGVAVGRSAATVAHTNLQTVFLAFSFGFRNLLFSTTLNMRLNVDAVGQIRCFGVNATSPRAREPGSTCGDLIQAYLLVSSIAQAATLSMYPSSWISKIGMHANTFRIESFEFSQLRQRNTTKMTLATHRLSTHRPACYMLTLLLPGHTQHMRCVRTMALLLVGVLLP